MKAVVMAGGEGSRLRPLTLERPKPMLPVVNRPVLGHILHLLKQHGIVDVVITVQYLAAQIQDSYGDGRALGMNIEYVVEESPLGTAGSVRNARHLLSDDEPFLVISGDALTDFDLTALVAFHRAKGALVTVVLYQVSDPLDYGVINVDADGRVTQFLEKPRWREVMSDTVNTGIYVIEPKVLDGVPDDRAFDWSQQVFPPMLAQGKPIYGFVAGGYWCDIGTLSEYRRANADLLNGLLDLGELGQRIGPGIWAGGDVKIAPDAELYGPIYLGEEVEIRSKVVIQGPAAIRDYTVVDDYAQIDRSMIWRNCYIGRRTQIHGAIIARQCSLKTGAAVFEGAVIGDRTVIGAGALIQPGVKIWPGKEVEAGATVSRSLIWGSHGRRALFGRYGVTGVVNVDLTPDSVARLGAAFGSVLPRASTVVVNRDPHRSSRMIKRALISGLPSTGNHVEDTRTVPIPVARYHIRASEAAGGVHVRVSPFDPRVADIRFFGADGLNLTRDQERAIERVYFREDFRRAYMDDIGNIDYAPDAGEVYARGYLETVDASVIRSAGLRIVVDYAHSPAADVLADLLHRLNVEVVPLNARIDPNKISISQEEFRAGLRQLSRITGALQGISLGVRLDVGGERIFVVDEAGTNLPGPVMSAAMAALMFQAHPGSCVAITTDQSLVFERLAERYGGCVARHPVDLPALMQTAARGGIDLACDSTGNFIFPALHPVNDGLLAVGQLLELLARQKTRLSDVVAGLPPFYLSQGQVNGFWETKGRVMRCLMQQFSKLPHETVDGLKVILGEDEWILIRPDEETATYHLIAEARSISDAQQLIADYGGIVQSLINEPCPNPPELTVQNSEDFRLAYESTRP
jgi:mannose-1-phosphate guanylyltransferase/phosphomannomutase